MAWWTHCTKTGRVVYDRKRHPFKWCDLARISRDMPPLDPLEPEKYIKNWVCLEITSLNLMRARVQAMGRIAISVAGVLRSGSVGLLTDVLTKHGIDSIEELFGEKLGGLLEESDFLMAVLRDLGFSLGRSTQLPRLPTTR